MKTTGPDHSRFFEWMDELNGEAARRGLMGDTWPLPDEVHKRSRWITELERGLSPIQVLSRNGEGGPLIIPVFETDAAPTLALSIPLYVLPTQPPYTAFQGVYTAENSNSTYGSLFAMPGRSITQTFGVSGATLSTGPNPLQNLK